MSDENIVRTITIKGATQGIDETTTSVNKLSDAQQNLSVTSDTSSAASLRLQNSLTIQCAAIAASLAVQQQYINSNSQFAASFQDQTGAANANTSSLTLNGLELASTANHLRQAAAAAYLLLPAFRGLVNTEIVAGLRATGSALYAMAPTAATVAVTVGSKLLPPLLALTRIAGPILLVVDAFKAMADIADLGAQKIKEFSTLATNAGAAGVSTDFFQRQAAGAKEFGLDVDQATASLTKFNVASTDALGGSALSQRLDQLTKAGNFQGNSGVAAFQTATGTEDKYRAVVDLITQAMDAGERLAAIDLASKFLPPGLLDQLRANGDLLAEMQQTADAIKPVTIVSPEELGYALQLKTRLDDAKETIANGLKPVQKDLTQLGLNYQDNWVQIVELEAQAVTAGNSLYAALKGIPDLFAQAGNSPFWTKLTEFTGRLGLNSTPESLGLTLPSQPGFADTSSGSSSSNALAGQLSNATAIRQAMQQAADIESKVFGDLSKAPDTKALSDANDQVDRAINILQRHTLQQQADTLAIGLGDGALASFRAQAAETAARLANGGQETAEQSAKFAQLKIDAFNAADALARVKVASQISFNAQTTLLSPTDVAIANQLKGIYGNDIPAAMASTQAATLRLDAATKELSTGIQNDLVTGLTDITMDTVSASQGFANMGTAVLKTLDQMIIKFGIINPLALALQNSLGGGGFLSFLGFGAGAGSPGASLAVNLAGGVIPVATGGYISGPGSSTSDSIPARLSNGEFVVNAAATRANLPLLHAVNSNNKFADGGLVGGNVVPIRSGGGVVNNITIENYNGSDVTASQPKQNSSGGADLTIMLRKAVDNNISKGYHDKSMKARFGATPVRQGR